MKIHECPVCHRNFSEGEFVLGIALTNAIHNSYTIIPKCPKCDTQLIKSDSEGYVEYED